MYGFLEQSTRILQQAGEAGGLDPDIMNWLSGPARVVSFRLPLKMDDGSCRIFVTCIERHNRTVRYDWLGQYLFDSIREVQDFATHRLWTNNHERPNMALGGITPKQKLALVA